MVAFVAFITPLPCTRLFLAVHAKLLQLHWYFVSVSLSERYLQLFQALQITKIASTQGAQTIACQNSVVEKERERERELRKMQLRENRGEAFIVLPQFSRNVILMCHADLGRFNKPLKASCQ